MADAILMSVLPFGSMPDNGNSGRITPENRTAGADGRTP
jgi:hypothetical protein